MAMVAGGGQLIETQALGPQSERTPLDTRGRSSQGKLPASGRVSGRLSRRGRKYKGKLSLDASQQPRKGREGGSRMPAQPSTHGRDEGNLASLPWPGLVSLTRKQRPGEFRPHAL